MDGQKEPVRDVIEIFLQQTPQQLSHLQAAVADQNLQLCQSLAHRLKSSFRLMGLVSQMEKLQEVEEICCKEVGNQQYYIDLVDQVHKDSEQAFKLLNKELAKL